MSEEFDTGSIGSDMVLPKTYFLDPPCNLLGKE